MSINFIDNYYFPKSVSHPQTTNAASSAYIFKVTYRGAPILDLLVRKQMLVFPSRVMEQGSLSRTCIIVVQQHKRADIGR